MTMNLGRWDSLETLGARESAPGAAAGGHAVNHLSGIFIALVALFLQKFAGDYEHRNEKNKGEGVFDHGRATAALSPRLSAPRSHNAPRT